MPDSIGHLSRDEIHQIAMDNSELRAENERLRAALRELVEAPFERDKLAGGLAYLSASQNARRVLNQQSTLTEK